MSMALNLMTDDEVARVPRGEESGFGALETARGRLPLEAMDVRAKIHGLVAEIELRQVFHNTHAETIEATYIFPLPDRAAVRRFTLEVAGRLIDGVIKERGAARAEYDAAIASGHRAAITEEERPGVFTMRVGNIPSGERATVKLSLTGPLPYDSGEACFRFPLVVAPRYIPGAPLDGPSAGSGTTSDTDAVPDASRITPPVLLPGFPNPVRLSLEAEIDPGPLALSKLRSSLFATSEHVEGRRHTVRVQPGERLNRDFILRFALGAGAVETSVLLQPDHEGASEGTFLLTVVPPDGAASKPRDVVFVLDRSGSMDGWKMVAARRAVARMVDTLTDQDRFNVIAFDDRLEWPRGLAAKTLVAGTNQNRFRAVEFLATLNDRGGTEMFEPLKVAADMLGGGYGERDRVIVLATDGQVGNEDQIVRHLAKAAKGARIFALGIDRAVNAAFLNRLADLGGGQSELVESEERLDEVMDRMHRRIASPVLTELTISSKDCELVASTVVPRRPPDLFPGAPVFVLGRYLGRPRGRFTISAAKPEGGARTETIEGTTANNPAITALWARREVRALEDQYLLGRSDALEKRIVDTSVRFSVLSRFTAFVAVDRAEKIERGPLHKVTQAVEQPEGWGVAQTRAGAVPVAAAMPTGGFFGRAMSMGPGGAPPPPASPAPAYDAMEMEMDGDFEMAERMSAPRAMEPPRAKAKAPARMAPAKKREAAILTLEELLEQLRAAKGRGEADIRAALAVAQGTFVAMLGGKLPAERRDRIEALLARIVATAEAIEALLDALIDEIETLTAPRRSFWK